MAKIFCDNCEKDDQSISVTALLGIVNQAQVSESYGSVLIPGETPTLFRSTSITAGNPNVAKEQYLAMRFIRGEGFLPQDKVCPDYQPAKKIRRLIRNIWFALSLPLGFILTLPIGFGLLMSISQPSRDIIGWVLVVALVLLISFAASKWFQSFEKKCDAGVDSWWAKLTPEEKQLWRRLQDGSYCRRCATFSPAH